MRAQAREHKDHETENVELKQQKAELEEKVQTLEKRLGTVEMKEKADKKRFRKWTLGLGIATLAATVASAYSAYRC